MTDSPIVSIATAVTQIIFMTQIGRNKATIFILSDIII